jgi:hypothetical protein
MRSRSSTLAVMIKSPHNKCNIKLNQMIKLYTLCFILLLSVVSFSNPAISLAALCESDSACSANQKCIGGYCVETPAGLKPELSGPGALANIISRAFSYILALMGGVGFLFILWSGIQFLTSKGDPKALQAAQARLTYAIVGLIVIFLAYSITQVVTTLFGLKGV